MSAADNACKADELTTLRAQVDDAWHLLNATRAILGCKDPPHDIVVGAECVRQLAITFRGALSRLIESPSELRREEARGVLAGRPYDPVDPEPAAPAESVACHRTLGCVRDRDHGGDCDPRATTSADPVLCDACGKDLETETKPAAPTPSAGPLLCDIPANAPGSEPLAQCSNCAVERDEPHTWEECARALAERCQHLENLVHDPKVARELLRTVAEQDSAAADSSGSASDEEDREIVSGMVEERTSNASKWPGLIDDIIAYGDGIRRQTIEDIARSVHGDAPGDYQRRTIAAEIRASLTGGQDG